MKHGEDWSELDQNRHSPALDWRGGALRFSLLFGIMAIALALFAAQLLDRTGSQFGQNSRPAGLDFMTTGSTQDDSGYTVRRSVLQQSPTAVCIIHADGRRTGDCANP